MSTRLKPFLESYDKKSQVIRTLLKFGLKVNEKGEIFCGEIKIPYSSIAKAAAVDRRTVKKVVDEIKRNSFLKEFFTNIEPAGPFLRGVAKLLGYRCIVIEPIKDQPGILAHVSTILAKRNINIVQVVAEDPNIYPQQKLYVITDQDVPGEVIEEMLSNPVIKSVTVS